MREIITSRQNASIVRICKLADKKNRDADKLFRFDGIKLYREAVSNAIDIDYVLLRESDCDNICAKIKASGGTCPDDKGARVLVLSDRVFDAVSEEKSPEGIISVAKYIDKFHKIVTIDSNFGADGVKAAVGDGRIILLEDIRDPGNLGTVLRTAAAFGMDCVLLCGDCADVYSPKTIRAAMGAVFKLRTVACRDGEAMALALRNGGRRVLAAALDKRAEILGRIKLTENDCIAVGNEGHGLSQRLIAACDGSIIIPMHEGNESLNAATAASVFMWEISKLG